MQHSVLSAIIICFTDMYWFHKTNEGCSFDFPKVLDYQFLRLKIRSMIILLWSDEWSANTLCACSTGNGDSLSARIKIKGCFLLKKTNTKIHFSLLIHLSFTVEYGSNLTVPCQGFMYNKTTWILILLSLSSFRY
jgi:hypothetical protein